MLPLLLPPNLSSQGVRSLSHLCGPKVRLNAQQKFVDIGGKLESHNISWTNNLMVLKMQIFLNVYFFIIYFTLSASENIITLISKCNPWIQ